MMRWNLAAALVCTFAPVLAQTPEEATDARQIHWQRSLDDALAVAKATGKPLLLAVNMDGESASDRIVHEQYADPAFVALTRACVCLGASVFRHNVRDHDEHGRRIPCPRFGGITCGEHMALEPVLFEKYLADGERVAPRHALVLPDGSKAFDVSLSFDLKDIDRALAAAVAGRIDGAMPVRGSDWASLAARRDAAGRTALEAALAAAPDDAALTAALAAIELHGDAGSLEALRIVAARLPACTAELHAGFAVTAAKLGIADAVGAALRGMVQDLGDGLPGDAGPDARQRVWLHLLALMPHGGSSSFLLAHAAIGALEADGLHPVDLQALLQVAHGVAREAGLPLAGGPTDELPEEPELLQRLQRLDAEQARRRDDPAWQAEFAKTSLDLGRRHLETGARDTQLLLEDAARHFDKALAAMPDHYEWWIERARAAYFLSRFAEQIACAERALAVAGVAALPDEHQLPASPVLRDARAIEALRWIGDGHARLLDERAGKGDRVEAGGMVDGLRAFGIVAASPFGRDRDWLSFGSFAGALGLWRQELAIVHAAAVRYPASRDLRQALNAALWNCGRTDRAGAVAESIVRTTAPSADADWFAGYAWLLVAEDARRTQRSPLAVDAYHRARHWFASAAQRNAAYRDSCDFYTAVADVGRGHALAQAGDRHAAAAALVEAVRVRADLSQLRDGLGYDVLDLVDKIVEWRDDGVTFVAPIALLEQLDAIAPDTPFWAVAVSDSALREALRADGRNPDRAVRTTVDAAGDEITMPMGRPCEEGDVWLAASLDAARRAVARAETDPDKVPLGQSATIAAERQLERGRTDGVRDALAEAAAAMGWTAPAVDADAAALRACAEQFRSRLGPARPRLREGR